MIDLKFCTHSSNRLLHKSVPTIFLIMSYSAFAAILWQILKSHFERKQSKQIIQKIFDKKKSVSSFFGSSLHAFSWEKTIENHNCVGAGARKVEFYFVFCPILTLIFPIFGEYEKGAKYILKVLESIAKILKVLKVWK